jgi:hypothetical protein
VPWLVLAVVALAVAVTLPRPSPLVQRDREARAPSTAETAPGAEPAAHRVLDA